MVANKRGDISLSFGFIFSIILIAAIVGIAFYAISYFVDLGNCTEISLFYNDFQNSVDDAWASEITKDVFVGTLPSGIESVCIGDVEQGIDTEEYRELSRYGRFEANVFLYPPKKACDEAYKKIEHINIEELGFECFQVRDGKVSIGLEKGSFDSLVRITRIE